MVARAFLHDSWWAKRWALKLCRFCEDRRNQLDADTLDCHVDMRVAFVLQPARMYATRRPASCSRIRRSSGVMSCERPSCPEDVVIDAATTLTCYDVPETIADDEDGVAEQ